MKDLRVFLDLDLLTELIHPFAFFRCHLTAPPYKLGRREIICAETFL
jgi:hypothetical protein